MRLGGNDYTLRELGGAFGDLGTLVPFLAGYILSRSPGSIPPACCSASACLAW